MVCVCPCKVHAHEEARVGGYLLSRSSLYFEAGSLTELPAKQTSELRDPSISASQLRGYTCAKPHPGVYLRARDPNSGTDTCIANTLPTELSPQLALLARGSLFLLTLASCIDVLGLLLAGTRLSPKSTWRAGKQMRSWQGC